METTSMLLVPIGRLSSAILQAISFATLAPFRGYPLLTLSSVIRRLSSVLWLLVSGIWNSFFILLPNDANENFAALRFFLAPCPNCAKIYQCKNVKHQLRKFRRKK